MKPCSNFLPPEVTESKLIGAVAVFARLDKSPGSANVRRWCCCSVTLGSLLFIEPLSFVLALFGWFWTFFANLTEFRAVDALDGFDAVCVYPQQRPRCLVVDILALSYLIMLFGAFSVQKVSFC